METAQYKRKTLTLTQLVNYNVSVNLPFILNTSPITATFPTKKKRKLMNEINK